MDNAQRIEALGPAEQIIQALTTGLDHMVHNRPGLVTKAGNGPGVKWEPCTWKQEGNEKVVYRLGPKGKGKGKALANLGRVGVLGEDGMVRQGDVVQGEYRRPGDRNKLFPEIAVHLYSKVAEIWKADNEFAARWASFAFAQANRDLKVILAAFMLVQNRSGAPVVEDGEVLFHDEDYRSVGEAMFLHRGAGDAQMEPKLLLRVGDVLRLDGVAQINRELGFGKSGRRPAMGRYEKAVEKWLRFRERNPKMLEGLVKSGQSGTVKALSRRVHYKPETPKFFEILGWSQKANEHRTIAIGEKFEGAVTFEGLSEKEICKRIVQEKIGYKRLVGLMPKGQEMTAAIMAACIEAGSLSNRDLIILTPTLEALGLLNVEPFKSRWVEATKQAEDQRAANIARNVQSKEVREGLTDAADKATAKALEQVTRGLRVYCMVDKSGSMQDSLAKAQDMLSKFLGGFPLDKLHVSVFNTQGTEVTIKAPKKAAVTQAFKGHGASGGTRYASGLAVLQHHRPAEDEDVLMFWVGDSGGEVGYNLADYIRRSTLNPVAFGFLKVPGQHGRTVEDAAVDLGIPCFTLEPEMFETDDPYAVTRLLRDLIAATPVVKAAGGGARVQRVTLIEQILKTPLLQVPAWAAAA